MSGLSGLFICFFVLQYIAALTSLLLKYLIGCLIMFAARKLKTTEFETRLTNKINVMSDKRKKVEYYFEYATLDVIFNYLYFFSL